MLFPVLRSPLLSPAQALLYSRKKVPSLFLYFMNEVLDSRITFARADAATCATRFNSAGALETVAANQPRFDYDPVTLAVRGLLIEESRTNLLLNNTTLGTQSVTVTAQSYTLSFYGTGSVTLSGVSTAGPLNGTGVNNLVSLTFTPTAGSLTLTVSGSVKYANLEAGTFPTSPIINAGSANTRAADAATITGANFSSWFNAAEGTFFAEWLQNNAPDAGVNNGIWEVRGASSNDSMAMYATVSLVPTFNVNVGGVAQASIASAAGALNAVQKHATAYNVNDFATSFQGAAVGTDVSGSIPTVSSMVLGNVASGQYCNNWLRRISYTPRRMPNDYLQAISA